MSFFSFRRQYQLVKYFVSVSTNVNCQKNRKDFFFKGSRNVFLTSYKRKRLYSIFSLHNINLFREYYFMY